MEIVKNDKKLDIIYFVKKGDSLSSIADKFCVDIISLRKDNDIVADVEEGDILWVKQKNDFYHVVKPTETLVSIAKKYGVTVEHIKKVNNIENVFIGQKLFI